MDELPDEIGMTKITQPYVFKYNGKVKEDWGVTGFIVIAESHISFHTFAEKNFVTFDLYSCRSFNSDVVLNRLIELFNPSSYQNQIINRGQYFERSD